MYFKSGVRRIERWIEREREGERFALKVVVCAYSTEERGFDVKMCDVQRGI